MARSGLVFRILGVPHRLSSRFLQGVFWHLKYKTSSCIWNDGVLWHRNSSSWTSTQGTAFVHETQVHNMDQVGCWTIETSKRCTAQNNQTGTRKRIRARLQLYIKLCFSVILQIIWCFKEWCYQTEGPSQGGSGRSWTRTKEVNGTVRKSSQSTNKKLVHS